MSKGTENSVIALNISWCLWNYSLRKFSKYWFDLIICVDSLHALVKSYFMNYILWSMTPLKSEMTVLTQIQPPGFLVHSPAQSKQSFSKCRKGLQMWQLSLKQFYNVEKIDKIRNISYVKRSLLYKCQFTLPQQTPSNTVVRFCWVSVFTLLVFVGSVCSLCWCLLGQSDSDNYVFQQSQSNCFQLST